MKFSFRRFIAGCALIGALVLLYFELLHFRAADSWLWIVIASVAALLAMTELMSPPSRL